MSSTHTLTAKPRSAPKLAELEGLRAWLAWWVVIGHSLVEAGWDGAWLPTLGKLLVGQPHAVKVFIILSGFVIMLAIAKKHVPDEKLVRLLSLPFTNRVSLYLGRISYSTYLGHYFVIFLLQWAMLRFAPAHINKWSMAIILCTIGSALTLGLSALAHRFIEVPGIALGKKFLRAREPHA